VIRWNLRVLRLVRLHEALVDGCRERRRVVQRGDDAERFVAHAAQHVLVGEVAAADERNAPLHHDVRVLAREAQRVRAGRRPGDAVGVALGPGGQPVRTTYGGRRRCVRASGAAVGDSVGSLRASMYGSTAYASAVLSGPTSTCTP